MALDRISTGISGVDKLIEGGVPIGFSILIAGNPGTGKTIFTSHYLYEGLKKGEPGIYVSFSESKTQFYANTDRLGLDFKVYESDGKFTFLDFASITKEGIQDALDEILAVIRETKVKRLTLDSFSAVAQAFDSSNEARIALQVILGKITRAEGVTNMLITEVPVGSNSVGSGIEEFVVDGIIKLEHGHSNAEPMTVRVIKMRGTSINREPHVLTISEKGMTVYEKESLHLMSVTSSKRLPTGIQGLDDKIEGGFLEGTTTALVGASGVGKTTFSMQFAAGGVKRGEPAIYCSLEESPHEIKRMAERYGFNIEDLENKGLKIISSVAENQSPDAFISMLANEIEKIKPKRMVIDSLSAFEHVFSKDMYSITKHLVALIKRYSITTVFVILTTQQAGINLTDFGISSLFQNIILLRYVEVEGKMKRSMLLLKMRATSHDNSILEFTISNNRGIIMVGAMDKYVGILTGVAHRIQKQYDEDEEKISKRESVEKQKRFEEFQAKEYDIEIQQKKLRDERRMDLEKRVSGIQREDEATK